MVRIVELADDGTPLVDQSATLSEGTTIESVNGTSTVPRADWSRNQHRVRQNTSDPFHSLHGLSPSQALRIIQRSFQNMEISTLGSGCFVTLLILWFSMIVLMLVLCGLAFCSFVNFLFPKCSKPISTRKPRNVPKRDRN
ncbi:hypothetical protein VCUG_00627 [Vavraia culicis subsp. floridensis]|uniref:Uncharacterized protein n=1 Tax=Vavraia culicis (isolate floridensis) TaxID=948595 RepID=L2GX46_VAVCU|nr:uncharacterized protein VCUG_00627 [Vavraia culicis subsp. floridensis]ELA47907.1 hypothetical protein VCUG_00627 [Vavraia culicis subsp. floridensis]